MFTQSRQAQMGEMISMIAHQWRQPLNAISAAINVIKLKAFKKDCNFLDITDKIQTQINYLSSTINDFRDFFKPQKEKRITNFKKIVEKALILIGDSLKNKNIEVKLNIKEVKDFLSYENELIQVVLNLFKNAEDILVEKNIKNPQIIVDIDKDILSIEDNAGGIPEDIIEHIFDPYFSTKDKNGTGLGLYMSKIIVEEHCNGELKVENTKQGAKFTIRLDIKNYNYNS
jgi:signal transduction histidine kinase